MPTLSIIKADTGGFVGHTAMPSVGARLSDRWQSLDDLPAGEKAEPVATGVAARS